MGSCRRRARGRWTPVPAPAPAPATPWDAEEVEKDPPGAWTGVPPVAGQAGWRREAPTRQTAPAANRPLVESSPSVDPTCLREPGSAVVVARQRGWGSTQPMEHPAASASEREASRREAVARCAPPVEAEAVAMCASRMEAAAVAAMCGPPVEAAAVARCAPPAEAEVVAMCASRMEAAAVATMCGPPVEAEAVARCAPPVEAEAVAMCAPPVEAEAVAMCAPQAAAVAVRRGTCVRGRPAKPWRTRCPAWCREVWNPLRPAPHWADSSPRACRRIRRTEGRRWPPA